MNDFQRYLESQRRPRGGAPAGPGAVLARAVGAVAAIGLFALSLVFGAFVLTALLAVGLIGAIALRVWLWWQQRKYAASGGGAYTRTTPPRPSSSGTAGGSDVVEGEFEVLYEEVEVRTQERSERD